MTKEEIREKETELISLTKKFCTEKLDENYAALSEKLIRKMGRKRDVPFKTGKLNIWAAAVIHALGTINFLFDKSFDPYCTVADINAFFETKQSTVSQKSGLIRDIFNLGYFNNEFATDRMLTSSPFNKMVMVNGFMVPVDDLPPHVQKMVHEARAEGRDIALRTE